MKNTPIFTSICLSCMSTFIVMTMISTRMLTTRKRIPMSTSIRRPSMSTDTCRISISGMRMRSSGGSMKIHAIQTGTVQVKRHQVIGTGLGALRLVNVLFGREWVEPPVPIYAWVIEHDEGVIVVDTGETARTSERGYFPRWQPYYKMAVRFQVLPEQEVGIQLRQIGIQPK